MSTRNDSEIVREYLAFVLGEQEYGVDILRVQEIRGVDSITRLPEAPPHIRGVINLRGSVVPVVDLRIKFKLERADYNELTVMIVLNLSGQTVAIVVDSVSDVVALTPEQFRATPHFDRTFDTSLLSGIGMIGQRLLVLLDMDKVVLGEDIERLIETQSDTAATLET